MRDEALYPNETQESGLVSFLRGGVELLTSLFDHLVSAALRLAPAALVAACTSASPSSSPPPRAHRPVVAAAVAATEVEPAPAPAQPGDGDARRIGTFNITFYYVVGEDEVVRARRAVARTKIPAKAPANENAGEDEQLAAVARPTDAVALHEPRRCRQIAVVSRAFARQLRLQGTGKLRDGRVVNIAGHCACATGPCFTVTANEWGTAGNGRPLQPFRTVAVDPRVVKLGSLLYVPALEGRIMPGRPPFGGYLHDGCVVADDTGGGIDGKQLDLFVGRRSFYRSLSTWNGGHAWARHVPVYDGSKICEQRGRRVARRTGSI